MSTCSYLLHHKNYTCNLVPCYLLRRKIPIKLKPRLKSAYEEEGGWWLLATYMIEVSGFMLPELRRVLLSSCLFPLLPASSNTPGKIQCRNVTTITTYSVDFT